MLVILMVSREVETKIPAHDGSLAPTASQKNFESAMEVNHGYT
jgi:hypothetical protein